MAIEILRAGMMPRWMRIAILRPGEPVWIPVVLIPLVPNSYFTEQPGAEANMVQVRICDDTSVTFSGGKMSDTAATRGSGTDIGLDWCLSILATTSDGHMLGQGCCARLIAYGRAITKLQKALSRNGVKLRAPRRWRTLTHPIYAWVRNETCRVLNGLAATDVRSLAVDNPDFRGKGFSRTLTRVLSRAGRTAFTDKLAAMEQDFGSPSPKSVPPARPRNAPAASAASRPANYVGRVRRIPSRAFWADGHASAAALYEELRASGYRAS